MSRMLAPIILVALVILYSVALAQESMEDLDHVYVTNHRGGLWTALGPMKLRRCEEVVNLHMQVYMQKLPPGDIIKKVLGQEGVYSLAPKSNPKAIRFVIFQCMPMLHPGQ